MFTRASHHQNPELEARLERLRAQQANRDYKEMTKNVDLNVSWNILLHAATAQVNSKLDHQSNWISFLHFSTWKEMNMDQLEKKVSIEKILNITKGSS